MNRRQKKKYWKNHVLLRNRDTGALHTITMKDYETLLKIAGMTKEEHEELSSQMGEA